MGDVVYLRPISGAALKAQSGMHQTRRIAALSNGEFVVWVLEPFTPVGGSGVYALRLEWSLS
jgi:hypothetical protein